jgi:hypothetical protein
MTPEEQIARFMRTAQPQPQRAQTNTDALIEAALLFDDEQPPEAILLGKSYEPQPCWQALKRELRGGRAGQEAWGVRRFDGMWHCQYYCTQQRAEQVRDSLILLWLEGVETPTVTEFNTARGEDEDVDEWRLRQGIDRFGARLGSDAARVNQCLTDEPKTAWQLLLEAGLPPSPRYEYLDSLVEKGVVHRDSNGYYVREYMG